MGKVERVRQVSLATVDSIKGYMYTTLQHCLGRLEDAASAG